MAHSSLTPHHFEVIGPKHNLTNFICESAYLTEYLRKSALAETSANQSRTFVCIDESALPMEGAVGYFTLSVTTFSVARIRTVPVIQIECLARHQERHGEDWGNVLLSEALAKVVQVGRLVGIAGVQLQPLAQGLALYYEFGFSDHPILANYLYLPLTKIPPVE